MKDIGKNLGNLISNPVAKGLVLRQQAKFEMVQADKKMAELSNIVLATHQEQQDPPHEKPMKADHVRDKKPRFSMKLPKMPTMFASRGWLIVSGIILGNMLMQGKDAQNMGIIEEFKVTGLNPDQMYANNEFVAVAEQIRYNSLTNERDTTFMLIANPKRYEKTLTNHQKDYAVTADFLHGANTVIRNTTGHHSSALENTAIYYNKMPASGRISLSQEIEDHLIAKQFSPSGITSNDLVALKNENGKGFKSVSFLSRPEDSDMNGVQKFFYNIQDAVFPTGRVVVSSQAWEGTSMQKESYQPKNTGDDVTGFTKTSDGVVYSWEDKLAEFSDNGYMLGTVEISRDYFNATVSGKKLDKIK